MYIVRAAKLEDVDGLFELAGKAGAGLTTLPAHKPSLEEKISQSMEAFSAPNGVTKKRIFLLVLEDTVTKTVIGTSAIVSGVGLDRPFYTYRLLHHTQVSRDPVKRIDTELLQLSNDFTGASEMATLFLDPAMRVGGLGKLLSKARYLLMAAHPDRFADQVIAEIRGWVDENDNSPFWEAIGRHFFDMDFKTADEINGRGNIQFINDLMPKFPIYTALLPLEARNVIGRPHDNARPAIRLLEKEGFRFSGAVDIFDGGPALEAHRRGIWTVQMSKLGALGGTVEGSGHDAAHLACNPEIDNFRVALTNVVETSSGYWLPEEAAKGLDLAVGDTLRFAPLGSGNN